MNRLQWVSLLLNVSEFEMISKTESRKNDARPVTFSPFFNPFIANADTFAKIDRPGVQRLFATGTGFLAF
ncbi:hypothetical protein [Geoalkalibacter subterraneus]|uniref:hypothetical protein n=1 Tax=Geoalkalibacter subterraneus TaxID=483547 RepID=UPI00130E9AD4|nr:hypothetical protein [Geoalkalibacter subterraneus]